MGYRNRGFFYRYRVMLRVLLIICLIGLGLSFAYFLTLLGPQNVSEDSLRALALDEQEVSGLVTEAEKKQREYAALTQLREPTWEDVELLRQAEVLLADAHAAAGGVDRRLRELMERARVDYQTAAARLLLVESREYETALGALGDDQVQERIQLYTKAANLQRRIDEEFPHSGLRDPGRLRRLEREGENLQAAPLYRRSLEAETRSREAMDAAEWDEAGVALREAIEVQKQINMRFPSLQFADQNRLAKLEVDLISLESGRLYEGVLAAELEGRRLLESGDFREAAASFVTAARQQELLNRTFPQSRFASVPKVEELRGLRDTALGTEFATGIREELLVLDEALRGRRIWEASDKIQTLNQKVRQLLEMYPRNTLIAEEDRLKLAFLNHVQNDLGLLQERVYGQLLPIPGTEEGWHMTRMEVSQALYESIMLGNPSRNRGERYPVDSVTWDEAKEFCRKVSWLLARPVRLPQREEFLNSVGSLRYVNLDEISWNLENSNGIPRQVGTKEPDRAGFHDLLGNVAEWLESSELPGDSEALLAGGSAETSIDALADRPVVIVNRRARSRMTGFRFAVQLEPHKDETPDESI